MYLTLKVVTVGGDEAGERHAKWFSRENGYKDQMLAGGLLSLLVRFFEAKAECMIAMATTQHNAATRVNVDIAGDKDHPVAAASLARRGDAHRDTGDVDGAKAMYAASAAMYTRMIDKMRRREQGDIDELAIASLLSNLGSALARHGDFDGATATCTESVSMFKRIYGEGVCHPHIASALHNLAAALEAKKDFDSAETRYTESIAMRTQIYDGDNQAIASSLGNLSNVLLCNGKPGRAAEMRAASVAMKQRIRRVTAGHGSNGLLTSIALPAEAGLKPGRLAPLLRGGNKVGPGQPVSKRSQPAVPAGASSLVVNEPVAGEVAASDGETGTVADGDRGWHWCCFSRR
jgi:tetratricopeptide (TPR) repeat protein